MTIRSNHPLSVSWRNAVSKFDYTAPAELFPSRNRKIRQLVKYRRFDKAADAIRFAMEELPAPLLLGAFIVMEEERLGHKDIRDLYESADYPLKKPAMN
jgi:Arc/MetJ-type ribon-helix-helix transcriptional regulator